VKRNIMIAAIAALTLVACGEVSNTVKEEQAERGAAIANSIDFTDNSEQNNIARRLTLTSNPGQIGFVVLLNEAGQPILYTSVKGKLTSSGKRLTQPFDIQHQSFAVDAPSDEGTYGSSDPYIYFWDTNDVYHQWSGRYLYSDKPIRLRVEPLVISGPAA